MRYYYILGTRIKSKEWKGERIDFINHSTRNKFPTHEKAYEKVVEIKSKIYDLVSSYPKENLYQYCNRLNIK